MTTPCNGASWELWNATTPTRARTRNGASEELRLGTTPTMAKKELFVGAKLGNDFNLYVERLRLRRGLGAVGEKHTTAAGWEEFSFMGNTNAGKQAKNCDNTNTGQDIPTRAKNLPN